MDSYFFGTKDRPYHLSVGAVVLNDKDEVCCHYFKKLTLRKVFEGFTDFYILMRETMEKGESVEGTLHRGLMEEFGITGDIMTFLGSIKGAYPIGEVTVEKTTVYFLVRMKSFKPGLRSQNDAEKESDIQWHTINYLTKRMSGQATRLNSTFDESSVLERAKSFLKKTAGASAGKKIRRVPR